MAWMVTESLDIAMNLAELPMDTICIDGACTSHMVPHQLQVQHNILTEYKQFPTSREVIVGGGTTMRSTGEGILNINGHKLPSITVLGLQFILLSEPRILLAGGSVIAKDMQKIVYDKQGDVVIAAPLNDRYRLFLKEYKDTAMLADSKPVNQMDMWHVRLGHPNEVSLRKLAQVVKGVDIPKSHKLSFCDTCQRCKATMKPYANHGVSTGTPMEEITVDTSDQVSTPAGYKHSLDLTCVASTYGWSMKMKAKSDAPALLKDFIENADRSVYVLKVVRFLTSDHGGEFTSNDFEEFLSSKGILHKTGPRRTPNYNEQERHNRTLNERQRALLKDANLSPIYWTFARETAVHLKNLTPSKALPGGITPYEYFHGRQPDISNLRPFGCPCYISVHRDDRNKYGDTAQPGIFVGYNHARRAYNILVDGNRVVVSRSVTFNEAAYIEHISQRANKYLPGDDSDGDEDYIEVPMRSQYQT
jgi:hypothetical protein